MVKTEKTIICDVCKKESLWDYGCIGGKKDAYQVDLPYIEFRDICHECAVILSQTMTHGIIRCSPK